MTDILTARLAKSGRRASRVSQTERDAIRAQRVASDAAVQRVIESRASRHYRVTVERMQSLLTERAYVVESIAREREEGSAWILAGHPLGEHLARIDAELNRVFSTPCEASDFAPGGRFERSIAYHMRRIASKITIGSMLMSGEDARDILSLALVRAYSEGNALAEDSRGNVVPTLGSMFRLSRAELMRAVSRARNERRDATPIESLTERTADDSRGRASLYGVDPARIDWSDRDTVRAILTPAPRWSVTPDAADMALAERVNRRVSALRRAERERVTAERRTERTESAESAAYGDDDTLGVDAAVVSLMASGATLDALAARLGVQTATLARRLQSVRINPTAKGYRVARIGSDGRKRAVSAPSHPVASVVSVTRKRAPRTARVIAWNSIPASWRDAQTVAPVPHYAERIERLLTSDNESDAERAQRLQALIESTADATRALSATDRGAYAPVVAERAMLDAHKAAHREPVRCNCGESF